MRRRALIVGFGHAGRRFMEACRVVRVDGAAIDAVAVVDIRAVASAEASEGRFRYYPTISAAFRAAVYDVVFICTNDMSHFAVFEDLLPHLDSIGAIVCEKPLTETLDQARAVAGRFRRKTLFLNFSERHSSAVARLRQFMRQRRAFVKRAHFFWGKNRIRDPRPTIGILSELSHPLDLVAFLAEVSPGAPFHLLNATNIASRFSCRPEPVMDSVELTLKFRDGPLVVGSCSYLWSDRDRRLLLYLGDDIGSTRYLAALSFDAPRWDCDSLEIFDFTSAGRLTSVETFSHQPSHAAGTEKIERFLSCVIAELQGGRSDVAARLADGVYAQSMLEEIKSSSRHAHEWADSFQSIAALAEVES